MNGLNVLPLTAGVNTGAKVNQGNNGSPESAGDAFATLLLNLMANRRQGEEQTGDGQDLHSFLMGYPFLMGLEGLFLHNPAGKEANSGIVMGQAGGGAQSALTLLNTLTAAPLGGQWLRLLAQESLSSGTIQTGSGTGDMPHSELDQYRSEIIKLLRELNGKLEVITRPANATVLQAAAAAKAYQPSFVIASDAQGLGNLTAESDQNITLSQQANRLHAAQAASQASNTLNQATAEQTPHQAFTGQAVANVEAHPSSAGNPGNGTAVNAALAPNINGLEDGLNSHQGSSSLEGGKGESSLNQSINHQGINHQGLAAGESVDIKAVDIKHGEKGSTPSLLQQIVQALQKQTDLVAMSRRSLPQVERVEIQLHPAELGKIYVSVRLEDGQVHLFMQATESSTSFLLQQQLGDLRETLIDLGVACGRFEMGLGEGRDQQDFGDRPHQGPEFLEYAESVDEKIPEMLFYGEEEKGLQINLTA